MVSFDVESEFTNIPVEGAVQSSTSTLALLNARRLPLTPAQIMGLLNFVLRSSCLIV